MEVVIVFTRWSEKLPQNIILLRSASIVHNEKGDLRRISYQRIAALQFADNKGGATNLINRQTVAIVQTRRKKLLVWLRNTVG